jgi:multicomponent Na+:H+ antiporter subunit G
MGGLQIVGSIFLVAGWVFALTGSLGVLRMPDFYSRLHPAGKTDSWAQGLIVIGLCFFALQDLMPLPPEVDPHAPEPGMMTTVATVDIVLKLLLLVALIFLTSPTGTHAISKAARLDHHTPLVVDGDPMSSIVVAGDVHASLEEEPKQVFDVDEPDSPRGEPESESEPKGDA